MTTDDSTTIEGARLKIGPLLGNAADHTIEARPMEWGIKLTPEARRRLLDALKEGMNYSTQEELENVFGRAAVDTPDDRDWAQIEEALTEILMPPVRYITGVPPAPPGASRHSWSEDRLMPVAPPHDTEINIHNAGWQPIPLEDQVPGANNLRPPGHPDLKPKPPATGGGMTIQMMMDSHPERIQQQVAAEVEETLRRRRRQGPGRAW